MNANVCTLETRSPDTVAAISSSRTARHERPTPLWMRLYSANATSTAPAHAIHASQRSSGKLAPSADGIVGGFVAIPFAPPNVPEYW